MPIVTNPFLETSVAEAWIVKREWLNEPPWFSTSQHEDGDFVGIPQWSLATDAERLAWFTELSSPEIAAYLIEIYDSPGILLDIGSGTGFMSLMRAEGADYIGLEPSITLHEKAVELWSPPIDVVWELPSCSEQFLNESLENTTVEDNSITTAVAWGTLQYSTNLEVSAALMYSLMVPGGTAYITIPHPDKWFFIPGFPGQSWSERYWTGFEYDEVTQVITGPGKSVFDDMTLTCKIYTLDNYSAAFQTAGFTISSEFVWTAPGDEWPDLRYW
jgi:SAM-dependent methyltransferase